VISIALTGVSNPIATGADAEARGDLADGSAVIAAFSEQRERGIGAPGPGRCGTGICK
jgi:hypothetical protein